MNIPCTICNNPEYDLKNLSLAKCGHPFHINCFKSKSATKDKCQVQSCNTKIKESTIIQIHPHYSAEDDQEALPDEQNKRIKCNICNKHVKDTNNVSVTKCGHVFHFDCADMYAILKRIRCPAVSCTETITRSAIIKIIPETSQRKDQEYVWMVKDKKRSKVEIPVIWETVFNIIMEKFKDPKNTITAQESKDLMKEAGKLLGTEKWKQQQHCDKCEMKDKKIESLKKTMTNIREMKARYCKQIKDLKQQNKMTMDQGTSTISELHEKNAQNVSTIKELKKKNKELLKKMKKNNRNVTASTAELDAAKAQILEMDKLRESNEAMQETIRSLESQVTAARKANPSKEDHQTEMRELTTKNWDLIEQNQQMKIEITTAIANLEQANAKISEMNRLREENEEIQQIIKTLQSQVITDREANICLQGEIQELKTQNEDLTEQNEQMQKDLTTLKEDFARHDSAITDFMMNELMTNMNNATLIENLHEEIIILKESKDRLKQYNEELRMENDYRWELLKNMRSCDPGPGISNRRPSDI